ncbi:hypothetical protein P23_0774 [Acinetobacter calcoaceticus]|nr:hypothetical protein P23_0774 [Acinetobacter calcoaceticus]
MVLYAIVWLKYVLEKPLKGQKNFFLSSDFL